MYRQPPGERRWRSYRLLGIGLPYQFVVGEVILEFLDLTLVGHGLMDRFVTLQTADVAHGKPHPDMMLRAMAETGAEVSRSVMIGDTTYDMEMAVNAGTMAIGVAWGYHETVELQAAGAHVVVTSYGELKDVLDDIF